MEGRCRYLEVTPRVKLRVLERKVLGSEGGKGTLHMHVHGEEKGGLRETRPGPVERGSLANAGMSASGAWGWRE